MTPASENQSDGENGLVLLGGGHAHLEVLRRFAARPLRTARVTLVSMFGQHHYSSLVPAFLQGRRSEHEFAFDLRAICRTAGATFVEGCAESIDCAQRRVVVAGDSARVLSYHVLSIDVGSIPAGLAIPGVREHAFTVRPMSKAVALGRRLDALIVTALAHRASTTDGTESGDLPVCIIGAGAGGVEITLAVARRLRDAGLRGPISLIDHAAAPLAGYAPPIQRRVARLLTARGISLRLGQSVRAVEATAVQLDDGSRCAAALTIWTTGAAAPPLLATSALATDEQGFLLVDETLRAVGDAHVFGAGDCIALRDHPRLPRAGVFAVRQGPILAHNLRATLDGGRPRPFAPQRHFLAILDTGDGRALLRWREYSCHARWALALKHLIDVRFVRRYQRLE